MKDFPNRLRSLRTERELTLEGLANGINEKYGTSFTKGMLSKYENRKASADFQSVIPIARYFGVSLDYMIGSSDDKAIPSEADEVFAVTPLSHQEKSMIISFRSINDDGQKKVIERIEECVKLYPRTAVQKSGHQTEYNETMPIAAHHRVRSRSNDADAVAEANMLKGDSEG